jgi:hypothetical protein
MSQPDLANADPVTWLLEDGEPGVRYLALRDLCRRPGEDPELDATRTLAHTQGPIAEILAQMAPEGYWAKPGPGYNPKYRSSVWSLILLAQLGAHVGEDERIARACTYLLDHNLSPRGHFSTSDAPSGTVDCLQGNLCWALRELGCDDSRLELAFDWMARSVTGEGVAPAGVREAPLRYYAYKCGPCFACGVNEGQPCAWGAAKVMLAFARLPAARRTRIMEEAIAQGVEFLFSTDPAQANYPSGSNPKPSSNWWKFGFPVFYVTDILQIAEVLVCLGYGADPRLANALTLILGKQDAQGRWALDYDYTGKTWVDFGPKRQPNKWVTLRALRVLQSAETR